MSVPVGPGVTPGPVVAGTSLGGPGGVLVVAPGVPGGGGFAGVVCGPLVTGDGVLVVLGAPGGVAWGAALLAAISGPVPVEAVLTVSLSASPLEHAANGKPDAPRTPRSVTKERVRGSRVEDFMM
jgi:hypothetical protein